MGGIVNITTRAPTETSAFATLQGFAQPYRQYGTRDTYYGYAAETGFALKQAGSPWGLRVSLRRLENTGQPQQFYVPGYSPALYRSEEQTSELQSLMSTSFAVFCLKKK